MRPIFHFSVYSIILVTFCISPIFSQKSSSFPNPNFHGFYIGALAGTQNIFGGSFIEGKDILAQESKFVFEIPVGYRYQFMQNRLMGGVEMSYGFTDGNLRHVDNSAPLDIRYTNNSQFSYGLNLGFIFGKQRNLLAFIYANETKRKFDVNITDANYNFRQTDKQGMLKYGMGFEVKVWKGLHARMNYGRLRVDFGDLETNIDVEDKSDLMAGWIYQF